MGLMRINCGQPLSVGLKCSKNWLWGSVRLVPMNMALTDFLSSRYASRAGRIASSYRIKSRWYCFVDSVTNSSTSGNGSVGAIYIACIGGWVGNGSSAAVFPFADFPAAGPRSGKQASRRTSRQRQSFPPLYDNESSSNL